MICCPFLVIYGKLEDFLRYEQIKLELYSEEFRGKLIRSYTNASNYALTL
jgi:hypothetical protein